MSFSSSRQAQSVKGLWFFSCGLCLEDSAPKEDERCPVEATFPRREDDNSLVQKGGANGTQSPLRYLFCQCNAGGTIKGIKFYFLFLFLNQNHLFFQLSGDELSQVCLGFLCPLCPLCPLVSSRYAP